VNGLIKLALAGLPIIWLIASVLLFVLGLGFAGSLEGLLVAPLKTWIFFGGPWLAIIVLAARTQMKVR